MISDSLVTTDPTQALGGEFGGKAEGIARLVAHGAKVPQTLFCRVPLQTQGRPECLPRLESCIAAWAVGIQSDEIIFRSSADTEDSRQSSMAGLYLSLVTSIDSRHPIEQTVRALLDQQARLTRGTDSDRTAAFVVQPYIKASFAGVLFTSDPAEGRVGRGVLSYVEGPCSRLVRGTVEPITFGVDRGGRMAAPPETPTFLLDVLPNLLDTAWRVEDSWGLPLDIEFAIDPSQIVYFLQARPIASLTRLTGGDVVQVATGAPIPVAAELHPKIVLRRRCKDAGVPISPAWIATVAPWLTPRRMEFPIGCYTAVCIVPRLIEGKVVRRFSRDGWSGVDWVTRESASFWLRHIFLAEIWPAEATGMATRSHEGVLIEFARGHFVPKGLVPTSVVHITHGNVHYLSREAHLTFLDIDFETGRPVPMTCPAPLIVKEEALLEVVRAVEALALRESVCLEFGITREGRVFAIDIQEQPCLADAPTGGACVSVGEAIGEVCYLESPAFGDAEHFHGASADFLAAQGRPTVVSTDRPDLGLLREFGRLASAGFRVSAVVFERYSPLAHLSILLREWTIPAVALPGFQQQRFPPGTVVRVVAGSEQSYVEAVAADRGGQ